MSNERLTPEELGASIYELLRTGLGDNGPLSMRHLSEDVAITNTDPNDQQAGEAMIGCLFGAVLAVERSTPPWICRRIRTGLETEFFRHLFEQGAAVPQVEEWRAIQAEHFVEYFKRLQGHQGTEPPWELGRQFAWNLTGTEQTDELAIRRATLYILAARDLAQSHIDLHEPHLLP
jgi:hypothetical protein